MSIFKKTQLKDQYANAAEVSSYGEQMVTQRSRLVGSQFDGSTIDPQFWATYVSTGTVTLSNSNLAITSGTANTHYASIRSIRKARFVAGTRNKCRHYVRLADTGTANVTRRWGVAIIANYAITISSATVVAGDIYTNNGQQFTIGIAGTVTTAYAIGTGNPGATGSETYTRISGTGPATLTGSAFAATATIVDGA